MKRVVPALAGILVSSMLIGKASADIVFLCLDVEKCAFSVIHPTEKSLTFVLGPGGIYSLRNSYAGAKYCAVFGASGEIRPLWWPPTCLHRHNGKPGQSGVLRANSEYPLLRNEQEQ